MENVPRDFFFRNRRWFLILLLVIVFVGFAPFREPSAERLACLLDAHAGGTSLEFWRHAVYALAAALLGLGAWWRTWGSSYLSMHVVQDRHMHTDRLVGDGPFRRTRNPLYLGNMLMALGLGFLLNPLRFAILVVGMWILLWLFIRDEEVGLENSGGDSYRAYRAAVPRMLPSWRARIPPAGARPRWLEAFCGEAMLWMLAIVVGGMAVTLDGRWVRQRLLWGIVIVIPLFLWARRSSKKKAAAASL